MLKFHDDYDIDFYAESIVIEGTYAGTPPTLLGGKLVAVSTQKGFVPQTSLASDVLPFQKRLTFHLWGAQKDPGVRVRQQRPLRRSQHLWTANPIVATDLAMESAHATALPKNQRCKSVTGYSALLPGDDCFYQYEIQDAQDKKCGTGLLWPQGSGRFIWRNAAIVRIGWRQLFEEWRELCKPERSPTGMQPGLHRYELGAAH